MAEAPFRRLRVPASSANLGPGFDALGLALGLYLEIRFRPSASLTIHVEGRDARSIPEGEDNLIWQTALKIASDAGCALPPVELEIRNGIPLGKGLGSSAAALTAGVVMADALLGLHWPPQRVLNEAARIEGHPDNVAACVLGSMRSPACAPRGCSVAHSAELGRRSWYSTNADRKKFASWCARCSHRKGICPT